MYDRYNPFRGREPVGSVLQNRPSATPYCTTPPPSAKLKKGAFQDGGNTEVLMEDAESEKRQLTISIDRRQSLLLERWPPIWPKDLDYPLIHLFSEVAKH